MVGGFRYGLQQSEQRVASNLDGSDIRGHDRSIDYDTRFDFPTLGPGFRDGVRVQADDTEGTARMAAPSGLVWLLSLKSKDHRTIRFHAPRRLALTTLLARIDSVV